MPSRCLRLSHLTEHTSEAIRICAAVQFLADSLENSHNPCAFNGRVAAIFMVRLWS